MGDNSQADLDRSINATVDFEIRPVVTDGEIEEAMSLVKEMGWNLTFNKFKTVRKEFEGRVYVAVTADGTIIGTLSVIPCHKGENVLGNFVIGKKYRRKGVGSSMVKRIMKMYDKQAIRLSAVSGSLLFYSSVGFADVGLRHDIFYMQVNLSDLENYNLPENDFTVKNFSPEMFEDLCRYDSDARGYDMSRYLSVMTTIPDYFLAVCFNSSQRVIGYTANYQQTKGSKVISTMDGLYADSDDVAFVLYRHILQALQTTVLMRIQTIKSRTFLTTFGKSDPSTVEHFTTMVNGKVTPNRLEKLYSVTDCNYSA